jgi:hypothetical protein
MDEMEEERIYTARRMARKLARNRSHNRTVRKLPQSVVVVSAHGPKRAFPVRQAINRNKRLTYILLLGAVLCAWMYDIDVDTLASMMQLVREEAHEAIPGVPLESLGIPGLS